MNSSGFVCAVFGVIMHSLDVPACFFGGILLLHLFKGLVAALDTCELLCLLSRLLFFWPSAGSFFCIDRSSVFTLSYLYKRLLRVTLCLVAWLLVISLRVWRSHLPFI